jgi:hypothetical protein
VISKLTHLSFYEDINISTMELNHPYFMLDDDPNEYFNILINEAMLNGYLLTELNYKNDTITGKLNEYIRI